MVEAEVALLRFPFTIFTSSIIFLDKKCGTVEPEATRWYGMPNLSKHNRNLNTCDYVVINCGGNERGSVI